MFEKAISSVEIILCFMNLYICGLPFSQGVSHEWQVRSTRPRPEGAVHKQHQEVIDEAGMRTERKMGTIIIKVVDD